MGRRIILFVIAFFIMISLSGCWFHNDNDANRFKKDYESYNGTLSESGKKIRTLSIDKDNPMIYVSEDDIVDMIQNNESFVVYFGFATCPWCRSIITNLIDVSHDIGLDKVYYVDVLNIRDVLKVSDDGKVISDKRGTSGYYKLLDLFDSVLSDYSLKDKNGNSVDAMEKRIYAPNIVAVVNGKVEGLTTGISEKQTDGYMKLTSEMNRESYQKIKCTIQCVADSKSTCSAKSIC